MFDKQPQIRNVIWLTLHQSQQAPADGKGRTKLLAPSSRYVPCCQAFAISGYSDKHLVGRCCYCIRRPLLSAAAVAVTATAARLLLRLPELCPQPLLLTAVIGRFIL